MTLNTRAHIYTPTPPQPIFDHMLAVVSTGFGRTPITESEQAGVEKTYPSVWKATPEVSSLSTAIGQGLPCILQVEWGEDGPVAVWFDTAYGYSGPNQGGCSDLHAWLLTRLGEFLDGLPMPVEWKWMNEFTGEWHSVDEVSVLGDPVRGSLVPSSTLGGGFMTSQEHSARTVTITWDGSDEAFGAIREALGHGRGVLEVWLSGDEYEPSIEITDRRTLNRVGLVVHGARIRIECDSFAILPPEVTP